MSAEAPAQDPATEAAVKRFQQLRQFEQTLLNRLAEFQNKISEHRLVSDALRPMEGSRKCFQLVGGVLCERTVSEVLPTMEETMRNLTAIATQTEEQLAKVGAERLDLQRKHGIRVVTEAEAERLMREQQRSGVAVAPSGGGAGVLA